MTWLIVQVYYEYFGDGKGETSIFRNICQLRGGDPYINLKETAGPSSDVLYISEPGANRII